MAVDDEIKQSIKDVYEPHKYDSIDDFIYPIDFYSAKKLFKQFLQFISGQ